MVQKALTALILGAFVAGGSTCGKSTEDPTTKEKPGPDVPIITLEGVDTANLTQREKKEWSSYVGEFLAPCKNVPVPLAQCVKDKRDCERCVPAAKYIAKSVKDGFSREQVEKAYKNRFDPDKVMNVPIDGSPTKGPESAAITIVEFADFQCPHCGEFAPVLDKLVETRKSDVRFVYKFYVLGKFPNSENAARAAIAAGKQGKFWEMHHAIFANQDKLDQQGLDNLAKTVGVDPARMHADMQAPETSDRIARDRKVGEEVRVSGTPTLFINGRQYDGHQDLNDWITMELALMAGSKGAPPAGSGSAPAIKAAPPGSAAPASSASAPKK